MRMLILCLITVSSFLWGGGRGESGSMLSNDPPSHVTVTDFFDREVRVPLPVETLITLNSGMTEIVAALGAVDRTVGRDSFSTFPSFMKSVPVTGKNSSSPNMERILALKPDLLLADAMFDEDRIAILENRNISVIIESTSNPERLPSLVRNLGAILQEESRAEKVLSFTNKTLKDVLKEVAAINPENRNKPSVYFENRKQNKSVSVLSGHDVFIGYAGGMNIAADEPVKFPELSPEFIAMSNPDVIIRRVSGDITSKAMEAMRSSIMARPGLKSVDAVRNDRVYIIKSDLFISLRYPVGIVYLASRFHPDVWTLSPEKIHKYYVDTLFGEDEWRNIEEDYVYP